MITFLYLTTFLESSFAMPQRTRRHADLLRAAVNTLMTVIEMLQAEMPGETGFIPTSPSGDHQEGLPTVEPHGSMEMRQRGIQIVKQLGTPGLRV